MLIDTHAHLDDPKLVDEIPAVLERARSAGVEHVVTIATTAASSERCLALAQEYPGVSASVGIHPNHIAEAGPDDWDRVVALARAGKAVAIGETGLDRYWDYTPFERQIEAFRKHLELARELGLPVVIHCRDAEADLVPLLREQFERHGPIKGIMHSFSGDQPLAETCLAMGLHISFAGKLTHKNANALREVAATIPLDRLLVETDCPYLTPEPFRGKRNEPAFVVHTATRLAQLHGLELAKLGEATTRNARQLFDLVSRDAEP